MSTFSANHKPLPELDIDPAQIPAVVAAVRQLPGVTDTVARNLGGWLVAVHAGVEDSAASSTKSRFRRLLTRLAAQGDLPPGGDDGTPRMYVSAARLPMSFDDLPAAA